jgi:hypothetical protein
MGLANFVLESFKLPQMNMPLRGVELAGSRFEVNAEANAPLPRGDWDQRGMGMICQSRCLNRYSTGHLERRRLAAAFSPRLDLGRA